MIDGRGSHSSDERDVGYDTILDQVERSISEEYTVSSWKPVKMERLKGS